MGRSLNAWYENKFLRQIFEAHGYKVDPETHQIDYDVLRETAKQVQPKLMCGSKCLSAKDRFCQISGDSR